ncbi:Ribosomal_protein L12 [Hexamita inflata]|uniref:Ribosomal protein L12 n=1 Tax=Hexamita inflata TaxID=28002 RepID=A0AA86PBT1_9EUKA|nr:Ribosomal protein L12 [Hexamita inflata]CAI9968328.1 Ribosomal protein L12 [Hexamita inflata]CAI9976695.1 Ribosomal protein L12 [Hexamita inflata]
MPPKVDPNSEFDIYLRVRGGVVLPAQTIAPKVGPYGLPPKMVGDKIMEATTAYKGVKVSVKLHSKARQPTVFILPTASSQVIKALAEGGRSVPKGQPVIHSGTITFENVIAIAKSLRFKSYANHFSGSVCEILGTCASVGCNVSYNSQVMKPAEAIEMIHNGEIKVENYNVPRDQWTKKE